MADNREAQLRPTIVNPRLPCLCHACPPPYRGGRDGRILYRQAATGILCGGRIVLQKACIDAPPVIGPRNDSKAISCSSASPAKRSSGAAAKAEVSTGGMKLADCARQNGVLVNLVCHQPRQRATVRRSTPTIAAS